jgi:hypothetical protein
MKDLSLAREENNPNLDSSSMPSKALQKKLSNAETDVC